MILTKNDLYSCWMSFRIKKPTRKQKEKIKELRGGISQKELKETLNKKITTKELINGSGFYFTSFFFVYKGLYILFEQTEAEVDINKLRAFMLSVKHAGRPQYEEISERASDIPF